MSTPEEVKHRQDTSHRFVSWSDGSKEAFRTITVRDSATYTASFETWYWLEVKLEPPAELYIEPNSGTGWYSKGTAASTGTARTVVSGSPGTQYVFLTWKVDGKEEVGNPVSIAMDSPHRATSSYKTQYYLTIQSQRGQSQGQGWYDSGSIATISVKPCEGIIIRQLFTSWSRDFSSTEPTETVPMDGPKTIVASWRTDYVQLYLLIGIVTAILVGIIVWLSLRKRRKVPTS